MGLDSSDLIRGSLRPYPDYPTVGFSSEVQVFFKYLRPWSFFFFLEVGWSPFPDSLTFSFILACVRCPSSTCRVNLYKTDICPISLIPELLGMIDKVEEYGSARCRVLSGKGHKGNFPKNILGLFSSLVLYQFYPFFQVGFWICRGLNCPWLYSKTVLCSMLSGLDHSSPRLGPSDSPRANRPGP